MRTQAIPGIAAMAYLSQNGIGLKVSAELPQWYELLLHLAIFVVLEEVMFYYSHWALHQGSLYKNIHKIHQ